MSQKLKCILLVDDSEMDNFFHKVIINKAGVTENVTIKENAAEALNLLKNKDMQPPELIFLDINMPGMNGWEFLEEYRKLEKEKKERMHIVMLSTSLNPDDRKKAESIAEIVEYRSKPLSREMLIEIVERYFG